MAQVLALMDTPTSTNQPVTTFAETGEIKPPVIEYVKNNPSTTTHLPCPSSGWLESASYDSSSLRLTVNTKTGASFQHAMVYPAQFAQMQLEKSVGSYYAKAIKGKYPIVHIRKIAKLSNYPSRKESPHVKNRFAKPHSERYISQGRYA